MHAQMADLETLFFHHKSKSTTHQRMFMNIFCLYLYSVTQGSRAPCVKVRASARCAAAPEGLPVTFMFSNACEGKKISPMRGDFGSVFTEGLSSFINIGCKEILNKLEGLCPSVYDRRT